GNVRELRNAVERAVALCPGGAINIGDLPEPIRRLTPARTSTRRPLPPLRQWKDGLEVEHIREVLRKHNEGRAAAARELGISRGPLNKKWRRSGLHGGGPSPGRGSSPRVAEVA